MALFPVIGIPLGGDDIVCPFPAANRLAEWWAGDGSAVYSKRVATGGDNSPVTGWTDETSTYTPVQTTTGNQPTYKKKVAALNNRSAVLFDTDDYLIATVTAGIVAPLSVYTIYAVLTCTNVSSGYIYSEGAVASATPLARLGVSVGGAGDVTAQHRDDATTLLSYSTAASLIADGAKHLITLRRIAVNSWSTRVDGVQKATATTAPGTTTINRITLGCRANSPALFLNGNLALVRCSNADDYTTLETLIAAHYAITLP